VIDLLDYATTRFYIRQSYLVGCSMQLANTEILLSTAHMQPTITWKARTTE